MGHIPLMNSMILKFSKQTTKKLLPNEKVEAYGIYQGAEGVISKGDFCSKSELRLRQEHKVVMRQSMAGSNLGHVSVRFGDICWKNIKLCLLLLTLLHK